LIKRWFSVKSITLGHTSYLFINRSGEEQKAGSAGVLQIKTAKVAGMLDGVPFEKVTGAFEAKS
jgi:hypothetical protein